MNPGETEFNKQFYEAVRAALPADIKILFISLTGSQGKNLAASDSDYDIRVIILSPYDKYLLQKPKQTIQINTTFQGVTLEGTAVDLIKAFGYALETNPFIIDTLRGIPVYNESEELLESLRRVFIEAYLPLVPMNAFQGILYHFLNRELKDKDRKYLEKAPAKAIVESLFIVLEIRCVLTGKNILNYFDIDKLLEFAGEEEQFMKDMVDRRRKNKKEEIPITEKLDKIIQGCLEEAEKFVKSFAKDEKERIHAKREELKEEVDKVCLEIISSNKNKEKKLKDAEASDVLDKKQ